MMNRGDIFVFGSNLAGIHGKGAALYALRKYGAMPGASVGLQGQSYAIPTKDAKLNPLPLDVIHEYVAEFLCYASRNSHIRFMVTRIGCGLAGYTDEEISPMFHGSPCNVVLPKAWGGEGYDW